MLGPILFLLYRDDVSNLNVNVILLAFAGDTVVVKCYTKGQTQNSRSDRNNNKVVETKSNY